MTISCLNISANKILILSNLNKFYFQKAIASDTSFSTYKCIIKGLSWYTMY